MKIAIWYRRRNDIFDSGKFSHDCVAEICATAKILDKICLKAIRDIFFPNMLSVIRGGKEDWGWYPTDGENLNF